MTYRFRPLESTDLHLVVSLTTYAFTHTQPLEEVQRTAVEEFHRVWNHPAFTRSRVVCHPGRQCPVGVIFVSNSWSALGRGLHITSVCIDGTHQEYVDVLRQFIMRADDVVAVTGNTRHPAIVEVYKALGFRFDTGGPPGAGNPSIMAYIR